MNILLLYCKKGSELGLILFLLNINEMLNLTSGFIYSYADNVDTYVVFQNIAIPASTLFTVLGINFNNKLSWKRTSTLCNRASRKFIVIFFANLSNKSFKYYNELYSMCCKLLQTLILFDFFTLKCSEEILLNLKTSLSSTHTRQIHNI